MFYLNVFISFVISIDCKLQAGTIPPPYIIETLLYQLKPLKTCFKIYTIFFLSSFKINTYLLKYRSHVVKFFIQPPPRNFVEESSPIFYFPKLPIFWFENHILKFILQMQTIEWLFESTPKSFTFTDRFPPKSRNICLEFIFPISIKERK